jgi:hypothetical protein
MQLSARDTLTPFAARVFGIALIIAPLLLLASTIAYITEGDGINNGVLGGTIGVWSVFALAIAFIGLFRLLEPHAPRAAVVLTVIAVTGCAAGVAFNIQATFTALYGIDIMQDGALTGLDLISIFAFLPWGWFVPITFIATGIVLWRTRVVARHTAILFIAGGVLFVASRPEQINVLAIVSDIVILLALGPIGWAALTEGRAPQPATPEPVTRSDSRAGCACDDTCVPTTAGTHLGC